MYEKNKFEGHILIESLKKFEEKFNLKQKLIIVADRVMISNCNLIKLDNKGYKCIIGAKVKSLKEDLKSKIASLIFKDDSDIKESTLDEILPCNTSKKDSTT